MRMALWIGLAGILVAWGVALAQSGGAKTWDFQSDSVNSPPAGFSFGRTGGGSEGKWVVLTDASAPAGDHVLAQTDTDDRSRKPAAPSGYSTALIPKPPGPDDRTAEVPGRAPDADREDAGLRASAIAVHAEGARLARAGGAAAS